MSQVRVFSRAILAVAVTVNMRAAFRAVFPLWDPPAFFLVTTGPRIARSAILLSLFRCLIRGRDRASAADGNSVVLSGSRPFADVLSEARPRRTQRPLRWTMP